MIGFACFFLKEIIALYNCVHWALYQEDLNIHSRIISCPDGITPNSGLTGLSILYIYIYIYTGEYVAHKFKKFKQCMETECTSKFCYYPLWEVPC